ncbi:hypothetical protein COW64_17325 [bacterium (Candidatus Blackallbacteria) CG18_big_fil_WC_8_21_14_2_50_49_26]|nr:MAG: hypothetical protein COW64_17325 [bacterium (Candidatus Blackallbacteria) CG18_big_fil_WC_8_21_14_2_50_49_26]
MSRDGCQIVAPTSHGVTALSRTMAQEEQEELWAWAHLSPYRGLRWSIASSMETFMFVSPHGEPLCIGGFSLVSILDKSAAFWLLTSEGLGGYARAFVCENIKMQAGAMAQYRYLFNYIGSWHRRSLRWAEWMGMTVHPATVMGVEQRLWHKVDWRREDG